MNLIVVWLLFLVATTRVQSEGNGGNHQGQCIEKEKEALLNFKRVVDPGNILSSWTNNSTNQSCCDWSGITCDNQTNHVIMIDLGGVYDDKDDGYDYKIGGEIGSSLVELKHLNHLDLSWNNFSRIPKFIGSFKELTYLNLAENPITGSIPPELGNLTKLQFLDLSSNSDHDQMIADNLGWISHLTSLRTFTLKNANFTEAGLQSFKGVPSLSSLDISYCLLPKVDTSSLSYSNYSSNFLKNLAFQDSSIHPTAITWFLNSSINLIYLTVINNIIDGSFPDSFGEKNSLSQVDMYGNEVESGVPKSMGNLTSLKYLDLSSNNLSGSLPDVLQNLSGSTRNSLEILKLFSNKFGGLIFDDDKTFPSLRELYLGRNQLEGPFPNHLSRFPNLSTLSLDDNQLTGPLPDLSSMSSLTSFTARNNKFSGTSTESIGELFYLETLDVSANSLTGVISEVNLRCPKLRNLDLSYNSDVTLKFNSTWAPSFQLASIRLTSCKLGPQFPSWLQTQSNLVNLDISNSDFSGPVPSWFSNITSKLSYLNMSLNLLNSTLPNFPITDAFTVDLSSNQFQGSIPPSLSNARVLFLSNNKFTDCRSFLCEAKNGLTTALDLSNNELSGSLPDCWGTFKLLAVLNLGNNNLSGEIPTSISSNYVRALLLRHNNFSGELPSSLKNCSELQVLDIGKNNLKGTIPSWIGGRLTKLVFLSLKSNNMYGRIPMNLCHLTEIQILDLSLNDLSGAVPSCITNFTSMVQKNYLKATISINMFPFSRVLVPSFLYETTASIIWKGVEYKYDKILGLLRIIILSSNNLTGEIPVEITHLVQLVQLNLSWNALSGAIPTMIGNLSKLESLDFSHNKIFGKIPISLAEISTLNYLDLSHNQLSGRIPTGTQLQSFSPSKYSMNLGVCGPPLTNSCPGDETLNNPSYSTRDDESYDGDNGGWFEMSWFYTGIGVGFSIGFFGVCGNLAINTAWRTAYFGFAHSLGDWLYVMITVKGAALRKKLAWD